LLVAFLPASDINDRAGVTLTLLLTAVTYKQSIADKVSCKFSGDDVLRQLARSLVDNLATLSSAHSSRRSRSSRPWTGTCSSLLPFCTRCSSSAPRRRWCTRASAPMPPRPLTARRTLPWRSCGWAGTAAPWCGPVVKRRLAKRRETGKTPGQAVRPESGRIQRLPGGVTVRWVACNGAPPFSGCRLLPSRSPSGRW
jgi:hypothetical protein